MKVPSISEADMVQVNMRRTAIDKLPVVDTDPERPAVWVLVGRNKQVVETHYHYYLLGKESSEYPLRPVKDAWQDLVSGKAHIARIGENTPGSEVVIRNFSLAYCESLNFQDFTQPVFVITGDNDFMAYVPAIDRSAGVKKKK